MRAGLAGALLLVAAGCSLELGATMSWVPAAEIDGELRPELGPEPLLAPAALADRGIATRPLRVVTFNVERLEDVDATAQAILGHPELARAGLFLVQELESHPAEGRSRAARLADALGLGYVYLPARMKGAATHGLGIFSAFPILDVRTMELPYAELNVAEARRIAVSADILVDGRRLHVINVHLDTVLNVTDRILQLRPAVIGAPEAVLVAGDMNTGDWIWAGSAVPLWPAHTALDTSQAPILDDYMRALGFATPCADLGSTEHMNGFEFRLDAFFTRGLRVGPAHIDRDVDVSDHWPMWIDVTL